MQKGREVDSTAAPRTGGTRRSSRRVGIVLHGAVQGRAMRFSQGLLKAVPLIGVLQREAWKRSEAKQRGWTKTPNGSEWWKNSDLWHVKASVKVSWWSWLCKVQFRAPESRSIQRRSLTGTSSLVWCMKDMKVLCGAHHLIRSEPPASREEKMRLMLCTKGLFQLQNFWFLRGWFGGLPDDETSTGDWSIIETKGVASESEFYVDFPGIVKFESEDFEIQKSQKQSIAHNSCHCWLFGPLKIQHVFLEIENKVLEVSATNSGVLENVFGRAHGTHFVRLKTCPLSIPYGRHLPSLTTRPGFMVASASRKTSIACWKKHGFCWGKKHQKNKTCYVEVSIGFLKLGPQVIIHVVADQWENHWCDLPPLPPQRPRHPKRCPGAWCAPHGRWDLEKSQRNFQRSRRRFWCRAATWSPGTSATNGWTFEKLKNVENLAVVGYKKCFG